MNPTIQPCPGAVFFRIARLEEKTGKTAEGRRWRAPRHVRLYGDPGADGEVAEQWPVGDFRIVDIQKRWGAGKYCVTWLGSGGERLKSVTFVLSSPATGPSRLKPKREGRAAGDDDAPAPPASNRDIAQLGPFELIAMLDERAERAARQAEERSNAQRENDRQFMGLIVQLATQSHAPAAAGAAAPVDMAREMALLRREIAVTIQERMGGLEQRLSGMIDDAGGGDDPDLPIPKDLGAAVEQVGISILREVTSAAPDVVQEVLPALLKGLKRRGITPSAQTMRQAAALQQQLQAAQAVAAAYPKTNGAPIPGAGDEEETDEDENADPG